MTRKQAKRRKPGRQHKRQLPAIPWRRISALLMALTVIGLSYHFSAQILDRPIRALKIEGPLQRVSALQIEAAISDQLENGFLSADLTAIQARIVALPWIDTANVVRRWPGSVEITVSEQMPAATWGESGLLNTRGELFVENARFVPPELPRLSGPEGQYGIVATRYLDVREKLIPFGLDVRRVHVDARGAWQMTLANGIDIRLGRRDVGERIQLFLDVAANLISSREQEIRFVDMRYNNGFTIGWKSGYTPPVQDDAGGQPGMVAGIAE